MPETSQTIESKRIGAESRLIQIWQEIAAPLRDRFNALVAEVAREFGFQAADLQRSNQAVLPARRAAAVLAAEFFNPPLHNEVIADWLGISPRSLWRFKKAVREQSDPEFARQLHRLRTVIQLEIVGEEERKEQGDG